MAIIINGQGRVGVRVAAPSGGGGSIVTSGLILNLDAGNASSYPGTGTVWTDLSGQGNHATLVNGVGYSSADGGSLVFDGSNDYVKYNLALPQSITVITIASSPTTNWNNYGGLGASRRPNGFNISGVAGYRNVDFSLSDQSANYTTAGSIIDNTNIMTPKMYVVSSNGSNSHKIYSNDVLKHTSTSVINRTSTLTSNEVILGADDTHRAPWNLPRYNNIKIHAHLVYNRQLTDAEITQNYNAFKSRYGL